MKKIPILLLLLLGCTKDTSFEGILLSKKKTTTDNYIEVFVARADDTIVARYKSDSFFVGSILLSPTYKGAVKVKGVFKDTVAYITEATLE